MTPPRPGVLVTGVGRRAGIGAAVATRLAGDGWDVATNYWAPYDDRMPWGHPEGDTARVAAAVREAGGRTATVADDLADVGAPAQIFDAATGSLGPITALVLCHCDSVNSGLLDTTVDSFDRHYAVNVRGSWLLIREFARRFPAVGASGRIVALTSDATVGNLPGRRLDQRPAPSRREDAEFAAGVGRGGGHGLELARTPDLW